MTMFTPVRTAPPAALLSFNELDAHLELDGDTSEQIYVLALAEAATSYLDGLAGGLLGRSLVSQSWRQDFSEFSDRLYLPLKPVASITSVKYRDVDDVEQTLSSSVYQLLTDDALGSYLTLLPEQTWPSVSGRTAPVSVTFVAGYGTPTEVPASLRHAVLLLTAHWFENREAVTPDTQKELPFAVAELMRPYMRMWV